MRRLGLKAIKRQMYGRPGFELQKREYALGCFKRTLTLHRKCGRPDLSRCLGLCLAQHRFIFPPSKVHIIEHDIRQPVRPGRYRDDTSSFRWPGRPIVLAPDRSTPRVQSCEMPRPFATFKLCRRHDRFKSSEGQLKRPLKVAVIALCRTDRGR